MLVCEVHARNLKKKKKETVVLCVVYGCGSCCVIYNKCEAPAHLFLILWIPKVNPSVSVERNPRLDSVTQDVLV